jgi:hypothetical protein
VAAVLEALILQNVSGVLQITGDPGGAIYLDHGQLTYAEASWIPGLAARLRGRPELAGLVDGSVLDGDRPDHDLGLALIQSQQLTRVGLRAILKSMLLDAVMVLTMPLADETSVSGTRFEALKTHWAGTYSAQRLASLRVIAAKKIAVLDQAKIGVTDPLELRDLPHRWAVIKREHWEVASRIDGTASMRDLALSSGLALHEVIERVGYLVKKEMCGPGVVPDVVPGQHEPVASEFDPSVGNGIPESVSLAEAVPVADNAPVVRRVPEIPAGRSRLDAVPTGNDDDDRQPPPSAEELRRVLDGLRRLT